DTLWAAMDTLEAGYTTMVLFQSTADRTGDPEAAYAEATARINACRDAGLRLAFGLDVTQQNFGVNETAARPASGSPAAGGRRPSGPNADVTQQNFGVYETAARPASGSPAAGGRRPSGPNAAGPPRGLSTADYIALLERLRAEYAHDEG